MNIDRAFEVLIEEMGAKGMQAIKKNLKEVLIKSGEKGKWNVKQEGTIFVIYKNGKFFARVPFSKAMNKNYLESVIKGEL